MTFADKGAHSGESPTARSSYENMKAFLDHILQTKGDEIKRRKLDIDGHEVAGRLNIDIAEMEEILELFARFYIFFRHFFKGDSQKEQEEEENSAPKSESPKTNSNRDNIRDMQSKGNQSDMGSQSDIIIDEKTAGYLSDFCLLFKNKDFTPANLKEKFPALFDLWQQIPILFNVKVSSVAEEFSDKLRKHKAMGKKPKQLSVGDMSFKIEYK